MSRIFHHWGLLDHVRHETVPIKQFCVRRYADNQELGGICLDDIVDADTAPLMSVHRADLYNMLKIGADKAGVKIELASRVENIDFVNNRLEIKGRSEWVQADVIIAADGIRSTIRPKLLAYHGDKDVLRCTGDAASRLIIPAEKVYESGDRELIELLETPKMTRWIGPEGELACYPLRNHKILYVGMGHTQKADASDAWTRTVKKQDVLEFYKSWSSTVQKLLQFLPEDDIVEWIIHDSPTLPRWVEHNVALLGDAAHPMLQYLGQGAGQAVEDAALIAFCLAKIESREQINVALKIYELMRKNRAETVQVCAIKTREVLHLPDGEEQERRDAIMLNRKENEAQPDAFLDKSFHNWCWVC